MKCLKCKRNITGLFILGDQSTYHPKDLVETTGDSMKIQLCKDCYTYNDNQTI